ncbi:unnamed protein product [Enterobius vermicularis]|uniref:RAB3GAP2_N domain-containing protein n=1 Tax=Enterobius vermicularis TaxID=51028 RepID=A0A0N4VBA9_ENTVE|nr:unnamed protein product [Enterobius vermicularis]
MTTDDNVIQLDEPVFASPVLINGDSCGIIVTQHSSIYMIGIDPLCIIRRLKSPELNSSFVRSPAIVDNHIFFLNTSGQLFEMALLQYCGRQDWITEDSEMEERNKKIWSNTMGSRTTPFLFRKRISVTGETFGGATIVKCENSKNFEATIYRGLIGSRDEHLRRKKSSNEILCCQESELKENAVGYRIQTGTEKMTVVLKMEFEGDGEKRAQLASVIGQLGDKAVDELLNNIVSVLLTNWTRSRLPAFKTTTALLLLSLIQLLLPLKHRSNSNR